MAVSAATFTASWSDLEGLSGRAWPFSSSRRSTPSFHHSRAAVPKAIQVGIPLSSVGSSYCTSTLLLAKEMDQAYPRRVTRFIEKCLLLQLVAGVYGIFVNLGLHTDIWFIFFIILRNILFLLYQNLFSCSWKKLVYYLATRNFLLLLEFGVISSYYGTYHHS
jgi:hypothetical protein